MGGTPTYTIQNGQFETVGSSVSSVVDCSAAATAVMTNPLPKSCLTRRSFSRAQRCAAVVWNDSIMNIAQGMDKHQGGAQPKNAGKRKT